jgi:hypothetical protein
MLNKALEWASVSAGAPLLGEHGGTVLYWGLSDIEIYQERCKNAL